MNPDYRFDLAVLCRPTDRKSKLLLEERPNGYTFKCSVVQIMPFKRWKYGSQIVMRSTWDDKVQVAWSVTVVRDPEDALYSHSAAGTVYKLRTFESDMIFRMPVADWDYVDDEWTADLLRIMLPGYGHAYFAFWDRDHLFSRWCVNFEQEYRQTQIDIDFVDHFLDIVIQAGSTNWQWKDEHELAQTISIGLDSE